MKRSLTILSMLVVGALLALPVYAQTGQGIISGKVTGRDGMPAPNVQILIQRMNSLNANQRVVAQQFDTKTGRNGGYSYNGLPPGSYQVILVENGKQLMIKGDTPGDIITVADGREATASFDLRTAPAAAAAGTPGAPPPSAADLAADRKATEEAAKNRRARDTAFAAGTAAYKAGAAAEATAKDDAARAEVTKNYEEAAKQFQIVVEVDKKQDVAFANLGNALTKLRKYDESAAAYQKAIELKPTEGAYYNNLGLAQGGAKKLDEAKASFEKAASLDPTKAGEYLFNEGAMYNNNGEYAKAIEAFKATRKVDPNNKGALLQEAISYFSTPETMIQAEPLLKQFLTLNPTPGDRETAQGLLEAIHSTAPTEYKSQAAIDADAKKAKAEADAAAKAAKNPPKAGQAKKD